MIDCSEDYILENEKVLLRPLAEDDFHLLLEFSTHEADLWRFNAFGPGGAENLKKYIATALKNRRTGADYPFLVIDKAENKAVGSTRFYGINPANKTLEIGYTWYGRKYQGTYVNRACKYLLLQFAFERLQAERVGFRANRLNERSIAAMKSIGCVEEGILRSFSTDAEGRRIDAMVLSILRSEWFETVQQHLRRKLEGGSGAL